MPSTSSRGTCSSGWLSCLPSGVCGSGGRLGASRPYPQRVDVLDRSSRAIREHARAAYDRHRRLHDRLRPHVPPAQPYVPGNATSYCGLPRCAVETATPPPGGAPSRRGRPGMVKRSGMAPDRRGRCVGSQRGRGLPRLPGVQGDVPLPGGVLWEDGEAIAFHVSDRRQPASVPGPLHGGHAKARRSPRRANGG